MTPANVLIADDEHLIRWSIRERIQREGLRAREVENGKDALALLEQEEFDLALLDLRLPDMDGLSLLKEIHERRPELPVVMITAFSTVESAVEAMRLGAYHYVSKPFNMDELVLVIQRALEASSLRRQVRDVRRDLKSKYGIENILAKGPAMLGVIHLVRKVALSEATTVLLRGESGTGKDLLARAIHFESRRGDRPFQNITCTAMPETLLESELFGHEKGAFTDAKSQKRGLFEVAHGGTVFLDEIGDMPGSLQSKLLRVLEEKAFRRVGGTQDIQVDVRVIAATNRDLELAIREGRFREDLYYRLNIIPIYIPPLRERPEDIPLLVEHFLRHFNREFRKNLLGVTPDALESLRRHTWPGNIREVRNAMERAVLLSGSATHISREDLFIDRAPSKGETRLLRLPATGVSIDEVEKDLVVQALDRSHWNQTKAAELLGLSRDQIRYRIEKFNLQREGTAGGAAGEKSPG